MKQRVTLPLSEWPPEDLAAWDALFDEGNVIDGQGRGCHWAAATRETNRNHYSRWLKWISDHDPDAFAESPHDRAAIARVRAYGRALLDQGLAPKTVLASLVGLKCVLLAFAPDHDWRWLKDLTNRLKGWARPVVDRSERHLPAREVYFTLVEHLEANRPTKSAQREVTTWRDTLILAFLTVCPVRLKNLQALRIGSHIKPADGEWTIDIPGEETKTSRPIRAMLPPRLTPIFDRYLSEVRPLLQGSGTHDGLWPASRGCKPMAYQSLYGQVMIRSRVLLGININPHSFRTIAATFLAEHATEAPTLAASLLGHGDLKTTERHYIRASQLNAGRVVSVAISNLHDQDEE